MNYKIRLLQNIIDYPGNVEYDGKQFDFSKLKIQYEVGSAFNSNGVKEAIYNDFDANKVVFGENPNKVLNISDAIGMIQADREYTCRKRADRWVADINQDIKSALKKDPTRNFAVIDSFRLQKWPVLSKKSAEIEGCIWKDAKAVGQPECGISAVRYLIPDEPAIYMALMDFIKHGYTIEVRKVESLHFEWHKPKFWQKGVLIAKQFTPELNLTAVDFLDHLTKEEYDNLWAEIKRTGEFDIDLWSILIQWDEFSGKETLEEKQARNPKLRPDYVKSQRK